MAKRKARGDVYPKNYASMPELLVGLAEYFIFYNGERFHQALGYKTPDQVYRTGDGGGAKITDHFSEKRILHLKKWGSTNLL